MANNGYVLWRQWEETCGRTHEQFGELGPHERCVGGSVAKMVAAAQPPGPHLSCEVPPCA